MTSLVSAQDLARELPGVLVLDVQYALMGPPSEELYAVEHLPGAVHLPLDTALAGGPGAGGRHPLPQPEALEAALRASGLHDLEEPVVVYDQENSLAAARAWWVLRWAGLTNVRVLDGGLAAWKRSGGPVTPAAPSPQPGSVTIQPGQLEALDAGQAARWAAAGRLFDVRASERYRGEVEPIDAVAGHIPGATNLPMGSLQYPDGTFLRPEEIRDVAATAGITGSEPVATSCGSGVTAAQAVLALDQAGITAVPYIGSWSEWIADRTRPIATGPTP